MLIALKLWRDALPLHLGFALMTLIFLSICVSLTPWSPRNNNTFKGTILFALAALGVLLAIASWGIQLIPFRSHLIEFSRSILWWSCLLSFASVLIYMQNRLEKSSLRLSKSLQNSAIHEQLLIQSVAQVKKNIELKNQVRQAKRNNLRSQMNPHFLFNVLTGIQHLLLDAQGDKASHVFGRFRKLLLQGFMNNDQVVVSIQQELDHVEQYIHLESIRLCKPIGWQSRVHPMVALDKTPCPKFLLQPLVENAIWHGLSGLSENNPQIQIKVFWADESLILQVHDNGKGLKKTKTSDQPKKSGDHQSRGTAIIKERLDLLRHSGRLELRQPTQYDVYAKGAVAEITLPFWTLEPSPPSKELFENIKTEVSD